MIVPQHNMWSSTARKVDTTWIKSCTDGTHQCTLIFGANALMRCPMQPITLLATRAPCTAACWPRPWCCSFLQRHRTAVRLCSVQGCHSAKNISKYVETRTTLTARGCSPLEKGIQHHSGGMLFPRLSLHVNTRACPNGHGGSNSSVNFCPFELKSGSVEAQQHGASTGALQSAPQPFPSDEFEPPVSFGAFDRFSTKAR